MSCLELHFNARTTSKAYIARHIHAVGKLQSRHTSIGIDLNWVNQAKSLVNYNQMIKLGDYWKPKSY